jgi:hypothetical protein
MTQLLEHNGAFAAAWGIGRASERRKRRQPPTETPQTENCARFMRRRSITMNTVFTPPGPPTDLSGKHMNSVSTSLPAHVIAPGSAANADHVSERVAAPVVARADSVADGWDAYEVWRRFIKDARDRRQHQE